MALVEFEASGPVGLIRMNRPKWNQMSAALAADLSAAVDAATSPEIRAVVVHGTPNFCAGADIGEFIECQEAGTPTTLHRQLGGVNRRVELLAKPSTAAAVSLPSRATSGCSAKGPGSGSRRSSSA